MNDQTPAEPKPVDGTPTWAYDEDGYCVCCGNGHWKRHMPDCELRDALDGARFELIEPRFRRFILRRVVDETGISGVGDVAWGVAFPDGKVVTRWCASDIRQTCVWDSVGQVMAVHGHNGKTRLVFLDGEGRQ